MLKSEYLSRLRAALSGVNGKEVEGLIEYYRDLIDDGIENGGGEAFIDSLEPPELVAQNFMREAGAPELGNAKTDDAPCAMHEDEGHARAEKPTDTPKGEPPAQKKDASALVKILLAVACIAFAFFGAVFLFSFSVAAVAIVVSGAFSALSAFALFGSRTATAFAQLGFGIAFTAIGVLLCSLIPFLGKVYVRTIQRLNRKAPKPAGKFKGKKLAVALLGCFILGVTIFTCAFGAIDFNGRKLAGYDDMVVKVVEAEIPSDAFFLVSDNLDLDIKYSDDGAIRLAYNDFEDDPKSFSYENGKATLTSNALFGNFGTIWKRGVFFTFYSHEYYKATLYLPQELAFDVDVEISNGKIDVRNMDFIGLTLSTDNGAVYMQDFRAQSLSISTDNGAIALVNGSVQEEITAKTDNGAVFVKNVSAASIIGATRNGAVRLEKCSATKIRAKTDNGAVTVGTVAGDEIELVTNNGSVTGTIAGRKSDYRITAKTGNGASNLNNTDDGSKVLNVRTGNGSISLTFVE